MSKAKQKKKQSQIKRRQMVEEVFKKGKKQREFAKKFDEKIAQKQGHSKKFDKYKQMKNEVSKEVTLMKCNRKNLDSNR